MSTSEIHANDGARTPEARWENRPVEVIAGGWPTHRPWAVKLIIVIGAAAGFFLLAPRGQSEATEPLQAPAAFAGLEAEESAGGGAVRYFPDLFPDRGDAESAVEVPTF